MKPLPFIHPHLLRVSGLVALVFFLSNVVLDQRVYGQIKTTDAIPVSPDLKKGKLSNGLTYYIRRNSRPAQKVELRLVVKAGSILESDNQLGLAHFTEHMGFNGSQHFKKNDLVSFLQTMGVKFGADLNAYTSFDETVYILPIPVDKKENLDKGLLVLEDWASTVAFDGSEIDKERGVVLEEARLGKGANDRINQKVFPKLFENSPYANRLPIGKEAILKTFPYDAIRQFYKDWYRPDLMAVIVVGDIDPVATEQLVKSHFEHLKNPAHEKDRNYAGIPGRQKSEALIVTDKEATNTILQVYYTFEKSKVQVTAGDYRASLVRSLFQSMLGIRMQELTQKPNPPFVFGNSGLGGFIHGVELFSSVAVIGQNGVEPAVNALVQEDERARKFGFTAAELERSKKNLMRAIERGYNERDKTESEGLASEFIRNFLEDEPIPGIEMEYEYARQFLPDITLEDVNQLAQKTIPTSANKLVVLTGPEKTDASLPTESQLLGWLDNAAREEVKPYEENSVASSLLTTLPIPGKIISEKENKAAGFVELDLSNGVKVLVKSTDFKNDQVLFSAFRFGGQYLFGSQDRYNAEFAAQVVSAMGVNGFSPNDLRKVLAGKSANVSPRISQLSEGLTGQSSAQDIEAMLQLAYLYFTQPRTDNDLFASFISKQKSLTENMLANPQMVFRDSVLRVMYHNHPWAPRVPTVETFSSISEQRAVDIYKDRFGDANGFTFILVGAIDLSAIKPMVATYFGSLPSHGRASTFKDVGLRPAQGVIKKEVRKGKEPKSFILLQYTGEATYSDDEQLKLQALLEVLNIKITETLREEMSDIYGGGASGALSRYPYGNYSIAVSLPCGPENVDKIIKATLEEIAKLKKAGPSEGDLNKVKENWLTEHDKSLKENSFWLRQLQRSVEMGSDPAAVFKYADKVKALSAKELKETARKYFDEKNYLQAVLNPEQ